MVNLKMKLITSEKKNIFKQQTKYIFLVMHFFTILLHALI